MQNTTKTHFLQIHLLFLLVNSNSKNFFTGLMDQFLREIASVFSMVSYPFSIVNCGVNLPHALSIFGPFRSVPFREIVRAVAASYDHKSKYKNAFFLSKVPLFAP